jgi:hypothetical protein
MERQLVYVLIACFLPTTKEKGGAQMELSSSFLISDLACLLFVTNKVRKNECKCSQTFPH